MCPRVLGDLYWPIDLAVAVAEVKLPFRPLRRAAVPLARDAVTSHHGVLDRRVQEFRAVIAAEEEIVVPAVEDTPDRLTEFARDHVVRRHRPTEIRDLHFEGFQRVHLPYHLVSAGGAAFLVDRLAGGVDLPERHPHARTLAGHPLIAAAFRSPTSLEE